MTSVTPGTTTNFPRFEALSGDLECQVRTQFGTNANGHVIMYATRNAVQIGLAALRQRQASPTGTDSSLFLSSIDSLIDNGHEYCPVATHSWPR
jgi:hypothetical protein